MICNAEKIAELIKKANKIALVCHANPDGDTLGSGLALYYALKGAGKQTDIFCSDVPGRKLRTLYGAENLRTDMQATHARTILHCCPRGVRAEPSRPARKP